MVDLLEYLYDSNVHVDLLSDQTSCHVPYDGGYCPQGLTFAQRPEMLRIGLVQIPAVPGQAAPAEGAIPEVKQAGA